MRRYRRPKLAEGEIRLQRGKVDGDVDMCIFYGDNVPRCDRALVMNKFCFGDYDAVKRRLGESFVVELEKRGYDIETLRFSIKRKIN